MRTAICVYGQLRGDEDTFGRLARHVVGPNSADVYVHTWDYRPGRGEYVVVPPGVEHLVDRTGQETCGWHLDRETLDMGRLAQLRSAIAPRTMVVEEQVTFDPTRYLRTGCFAPYGPWSPDGYRGRCPMNLVRNYQRSRSQALSRLRAFDAIQDPGSYDMVVFLRNDLLFIRDLRPPEAAPRGMWFEQHGGPEYLLDQCAFGDPDSARAYARMHFVLDDIYEHHHSCRDPGFNEVHTATHMRLAGTPLHNFRFSGLLDLNVNPRGIKCPA